MIPVTRYVHNPVIAPSSLTWENSLVFNPAAIIINSQTYLFYRAMGTADPISRFGMAVSVDGFTFSRFDHPVFSGFNTQEDFLGVEDGRVVEIDGTYYFVYTAVSQNKDAVIPLGVPDSIVRIPQIAMASTNDFKVFVNHGIIVPNTLGKDASLFPRKVNSEYWLLYREGLEKTYFIKSNDLKSWTPKSLVFNKRPGFWDSVRVGIGGPPIETEKGWLLFYHGFNEELEYSIGVMFLDLTDPTKVLYRSPQPILTPEESYEKRGLVPDVIFTCGTTEKDGEYYIYYGAADKVIGLATVKKSDVLSLF